MNVARDCVDIGLRTNQLADPDGSWLENSQRVSLTGDPEPG